MINIIRFKYFNNKILYSPRKFMHTSRALLGQQFGKMARRNSYPPYKPLNLTESDNMRRNMSHMRIQKPDPDNKDPQALANNPRIPTPKGKIIHHMEINCKKCGKTDCSKKICPQPCEPIVEDKAIGHLTHGNPKVLSPDKIDTLNLDIDASGNARPQNVKVYGNPHNSTTSQINSADVQPATSNIQNNTEMMSKIKQYEK